MPFARTRTLWRLRPPMNPTAAGSPPWPADESIASSAGAHPGFHRMTAQLLAQRGLTDPDAAQRFLRPKLTDLHDPADIAGCDRAAELVVEALRADRPIVIYGDYDVDGVTSTAILYHTLKQLGQAPVPYIPHRLDEGYGLNPEALTAIAEYRAPGLSERRPVDDAIKPVVISVDCGITAAAAAAHARRLGLSLIITDHHTPERQQEDQAPAHPDADAIVHPGLHDDGSINPAGSPLCGAGVALKLAWQIMRRFHGSDRLPEPARQLMCELVGFAALGTVADVVPLVGENRTIAAFGLARLPSTPFPGLKALIEACKLQGQRVSAYHVGFVLGPRLNAIGRLGHAAEAVTLLTDPPPGQAGGIAEKLTKLNDARRRQQQTIFEQAVRLVETDAEHTAFDDPGCLVLAGKDWHPGIVGIVASKLVERYHRPTVVLCPDDETGLAKGSARGVEGFDLHAAIAATQHPFESFGGHSMAAGLTLRSENLDAFRQSLLSVCHETLTHEMRRPIKHYDLELTPGDCSLQLFDELDRLAPFGRDNPRPILKLQHATLVRDPEPLGSTGRHAALMLRGPKGKYIRAVAFNQGKLVHSLAQGQSVEVIAEPSINEFRGNRTPELHVQQVEVVPAGAAETEPEPSPPAPAGALHGG